MAKSLLEIILSLDDQATTKLEELSRKMSDIGSKVSGVGLKMTAGVTAPLVGLGLVAMNSASDLEESMNKVKVVFGDSADAIVNFADTAAERLGMSKQQALEAAGTFGNLFTAMGMGQQVSADMSTDILTLASDLASFNNMDPTEVLEKLRAGLVGETEPLRTLGVNLNQASIEAKALELGLMEQGGELDAAAKAQASFALIMEQTTSAQGDFARTSDGLANSMRTAKAGFMDAAASLGQQLLPIGLQVVQFVSGLIEKFTNLSPTTQKIILVIAGVAAAIGPLLMIVGSLMSAIGAIIPIVTAVAGVLTFPLIAIIAAVIAVVALLFLAWKNNWGGIRDKVQVVVAWISENLGIFIAWLKGAWENFTAGLRAVWAVIWGAIQAVIDFWIKYVQTIFAAFRAAFAGDWHTFGEKLREAWDMVWNAIKDILSKAWEAIKEFATQGWEALKKFFQDGDKKLREVWSKMWEAIKQFVKDAWEWFKTEIPKLIQNIISFFTDTDWGQVGKDIVQGIIAGIKAGWNWLLDTVRNLAKAAWEAAKGILGIDSPSKVFMEVGRNMMQGMAMGISGAERLPMAAAAHAASGTYNSQALTLYGNMVFPNVTDRESFLSEIARLMP